MPDSLADALRWFIDELTARIDNRETSVPDEDAPFLPVRETSLYEAAKAVERFYPKGKFPMGVWENWTRLLRRSDDGKGEADPVERTILCYRLAGKLRRWAKRELKAARAKPPLRIVKATINARMVDILTKHPESKDWSKARWADELGCSESGVQGQPAWEAIMQGREAAKLQRHRRARGMLDE